MEIEEIIDEETTIRTAKCYGQRCSRSDVDSWIGVTQCLNHIRPSSITIGRKGVDLWMSVFATMCRDRVRDKDRLIDFSIANYSDVPSATHIAKDAVLAAETFLASLRK